MCIRDRYLQAEFYRSDPEKKKSAIILLKSYDRYNAGITRKSFQYKTAVITNLLENWNSKPEFSNALHVIGANSWIEELTLKNNTFYEQYFTKAISSVPKAQSNKMKADIKAVFEELITDTTSFARVSPCLLYTSPSPRDRTRSRMPSSACKKKTNKYVHRYSILLYT